MYNNILLSRYFPIKSKMHNMDPFCKMLCTLIFIITLLISNNLTVILILFLVTLIMMLRSNVPIKLYLKGISKTVPIMALILIITLLIKVDYLIILSILIKLILIVVYTSILTFTSTPTEITIGFEKILFPLKLIGFPTSKIALELTMSIRYIPIVMEQIERIRKSQAARGVDYENARFGGRLFANISMIEPMFRLSNKRSRELYTSMELRMYTVYNKRTSYRTKKWNLSSTFNILLHILILGIYIYKEVIGYGSIFDNFFVRWIWF